MKKVIMPILLCIFIGFLLSKFMLNQYENKQNITPVFNSSEKLYFIQYGVYSNEESMKSNTENLNYYIYNLTDNLYYVFIGITGDAENSNKLKGYFKTLGYDTYIKEYSISNKDFLEMIEYYDLLLKQTSDNDIIKSVCRQVLEKYEESI
ncbi:MAG: hypothetical protein PHW32_01495 [Bacilli bacterium]|nr:hypothetical protein [Bacilli bacterium]MDD4282396.1 hypothetical protein [Bacilli bacterium]MDD4718979.1 hypothetical protein [Bacilli bacterium]